MVTPTIFSFVSIFFPKSLGILDTEGINNNNNNNNNNMPVSLAISEILSVKEWCDLENQVRGRSRSFKMAPFDRPYATFYWSTIVNIALCAIFELFDVE